MCSQLNSLSSWLTYLTLSNKHQIFSKGFALSVCFPLSSHAASYAHSAFLAAENLQYQPFDGFTKTPRRLVGQGSLVEERDERNGSITFHGKAIKLDGKKRLKWFSEMLHNCTACRFLNAGKAIHMHVIKSGIDPDSHLWVSLINLYSKCGCLNLGCRVFDLMPERDVVSWTALIAGFVAEGYYDKGICLFCKMQKDGLFPNEFTFATILKACSACSNASFGKQLHGKIITIGFFSDVYVGSALVDLYSKCSELEYAKEVFLLMPELSVVSWNALLNGYAQACNYKEVLSLFCGMENNKIKFSKFTLSTVLKGCANSGMLAPGMLVHNMALKIGCDYDDFVSCSLVGMYSKCGLAEDASRVFSRIKTPDVVTWSAMISCLDQQGKKQEAAKLFSSMLQLSLRPTEITLASVVSAANDLGNPLYCEGIHACAYKHGFGREILVCNALITMYMNNGCILDGVKVFDEMGDRDLISWNALLSGFHDGESCDEVLKIFKQMRLQGFEHSACTFVSVVRACSILSSVNFGKQVHAQIIKASLDGDRYVITALIDMYVKCKRLEAAETIFNRSNDKDSFTWTGMIAGYAQSDQGEKAISYFSRMRKDGVTLNEFTLASCLNGCSGLTSLESGKQLHSLAIRVGHIDDAVVVSSLVNMYGKCGCIDDAVIIFEAMDFRDTVSWNTIICLYSHHGQGFNALKAFDKMLYEGFLPDGVTFLGILSACSHRGLVELGKKHFYSMSEVYGITPSIEHYASMVDILGRAGRFDEVESFIEKMKIAPNYMIWENVLGACMVHGNVELGGRAAEKLFQIEPEIDSNYVLLSNIFAAQGRWSDVPKVRALMSSRGIKKEPGYSWVVVEAQTHVFLSQDSCHPRIKDIHKKLDDLFEKISLAGFTPKTDHMLHDVTEREKIENLSYHSERLALAFSLVSISCKAVRIFSNLRTCGDCHEYMKHASRVVNRDIVVRDAKRFHHFHNGTCSCQDYW